VAANILGGLGVDSWLYRTEGATTRYFLTDALGSTRALTDDTKAITTRYQYEPFGETTTSGAVSTNSSQYTGRENDGTGLYYYRARYYSPTLKRFISEDPIGLAGGFNTYAYVEGNPVSANDPSGNVLALALPFAPQIGAMVTAGAIAVGAWIGWNVTGPMLSDQAKPPPGSLPIDQTPWSGDHGKIKPQIGAGPADNVKIDPNGSVWGENKDGSWTDHGPAKDYIGGNDPSGKRGRERDKRRGCPD
jgi:RHS repeat-associated protein